MKKFIAFGVAATVCSLSYLHAKEVDTTGQTFLRWESAYQSCSPERLALSDTVAVDFREKHRASHNGDVEVVVFGGAVTNGKNAAQYYLPSIPNIEGVASNALTFNASFDSQNFGTNTAQTIWQTAAQGGSAAYMTVNGATGGGNAGTTHQLQYVSSVGPVIYTALDTGGTTASNLLFKDLLNADTAISYTGTTVSLNDVVLQDGADHIPTNFDNVRGLLSDGGTITSSEVAIGSNIVDTNKDSSVIRPWNFGIGFAPNVQIGQDITECTFVSEITPELNRSQWGIGATYKQILSRKDTGFWIELSTALQGVQSHIELNEVVAQALVLNDNTDSTYSTSWAADTGYTTTDLDTVAKAFAQSGWNYGKIAGEKNVTRLADIEVKVGYQFVCNENVMSNGFIGMVIPTGNKATAEFVAEPIVGNGFHFGLMAGGTQEIQLNDGQKTRWTMRADSNFRYLFENQQVRSFDTLSNGAWSRYMMVWDSYANEQLYSELASESTAIRTFTPGINVFTKDMNVTPQGQARFNSAVVLESGAFKGELGWNFLVRQAEKVELVSPWVDGQVAFVDASNQKYSLFNQTRTIYNDSYQSTPLANNGYGGDGVANLSQAMYEAMAINATDLNLESAASPAAFVNTPYVALGYAFNEEKSSVFSLGASYAFSATNSYTNDWSLWGKFTFSF